jgi:hypothetical protein
MVCLPLPHSLAHSPLQIEPNAAELLVEQMGNDIRQVINASQMWRAQSGTMKYRDLAGSVGGVMPYVDSEEGDPGSETAGRLRGIQKDKILRQSPFDACGLILGGRKTDFNERYNSFFIGAPPPLLSPPHAPQTTPCSRCWWSRTTSTPRGTGSSRAPGPTP